VLPDMNESTLESGTMSVMRRNVARHKLIHTCERPYTCTAEGCGASFVQKPNLDNHFARTHTESAILRGKLREARVAKFLTASGINFDRELIVRKFEKKLDRVD
jgi:hypothetical protein